MKCLPLRARVRVREIRAVAGWVGVQQKLAAFNNIGSATETIPSFSEVLAALSGRTTGRKDKEWGPAAMPVNCASAAVGQLSTRQTGVRMMPGTAGCIMEPPAAKE